MEQNEWKVTGMTCNHCALSVQKALERAGAKAVQVNLATEEVLFDNPDNVAADTLVKSIEQAGYGVTLSNEGSAEKKKTVDPLSLKFLITLPFSLALIIPMFFHVEFLHNPYVQLVLALPALVIGLVTFGKSALYSVRTGSPNMDVLVTIGFLSAFVYSITGIYSDSFHDRMFFETTSLIVTFVLLGNIIEKRSIRHTGSALEQLLKLKPETARKMVFSLNEGGWHAHVVPAEDVRNNDVLQLLNGDSACADGIVTEGEAELDESAITGESLPVHKKKGDKILSGSVVVNGSLNFKCTATGKDAALNKIIDTVKNILKEKPSVQKLGDRVSAVFVPVVLGISIVTFFVSYVAFKVDAGDSMLRAIAVLVISCPCAMGLATPTAVMVGLGKAARNGILFRNGSIAESFAKVKILVMDKTGTLTNGKFRVSNFQTYEFEEFVAKNLVWNFEKISAHPIAQSIVENYPDWRWKDFSFESVHEVKGKGIEATDATGNHYRLGTASFAGVAHKEADIYLTYNNRLIASFDIKDQLREGAAAAVAYFKSKGIEPVLLSGDSEKKVKAIAEDLGIKTYYASRLPDEKAQILKELGAKGSVAMVGDGINDAPALALTDTGISFSGATAIAQQSAGVLLLGKDLYQLSDAHKIAHNTLRAIKQNLFWALAYNVVAIPLAAAGFLNPMLGALSMAFSDVVVIGNALRLNWVNFKKG